jgi:hypothetical protein
MKTWNSRVSYIKGKLGWLPRKLQRHKSHLRIRQEVPKRGGREKKRTVRRERGRERDKGSERQGQRAKREGKSGRERRRERREGRKRERRGQEGDKGMEGKEKKERNRRDRGEEREIGERDSQSFPVTAKWSSTHVIT